MLCVFPHIEDRFSHNIHKIAFGSTDYCRLSSILTEMHIKTLTSSILCWIMTMSLVPDFPLKCICRIPNAAIIMNDDGTAPRKFARIKALFILIKTFSLITLPFEECGKKWWYIFYKIVIFNRSKFLGSLHLFFSEERAAEIEPATQWISLFRVYNVDRQAKEREWESQAVLAVSGSLCFSFLGIRFLSQLKFTSGVAWVNHVVIAWRSTVPCQMVLPLFFSFFFFCFDTSLKTGVIHLCIQDMLFL